MLIRKPFVASAALLAEIALLLCLALVPVSARAVDEPPLASEQEMAEAYESFKLWAAAFQARDYDEAWRLTDPRIRQWFDKKRWKKRVKKAQEKSGEILAFEVESIAPVSAAQLPCTEMGHCFRQGVQYVFVLIRSTYKKATPPQPEFVVMAKSEEGWKFGGGTFPDTPMGETSVILNRKDESRYRYRSNGR